MLTVERARSVANWVNLSTPAGLLLAQVGAGRPRRTRSGLWLAHGYRLPVPTARAFTLGNVILLRSPLPGTGVDPAESVPPRLLAHEERHATQYALCGGIFMPTVYVAAAGWSWLRTGDFASRNWFERAAGLADGGYRERPVRPLPEGIRAAVRLLRILRAPVAFDPGQHRGASAT